MASISTAPDASQRATLRLPLRTYSRRLLKRRHTSSPISETQRTIRRVKSLSATSSQPLAVDPGRDRTSPIFSGFAKKDKTPNDLAWEEFTTPAPVLTQCDDSHPVDEKSAGEPHVAKEPEDRQPDTGEPIYDGPDGEAMLGQMAEGQTPQDASEHEGEDGMCPEESASEDDTSERDEGTEGDDTALTCSSGAGSSYFSATSASQKPRVRAPSLIFDKSPPRGFKVLEKRKASSDHFGSAKKRNRLSDGFSDEEARPSPIGRRRRLHHQEPDVGSLELTQKVAASQRSQRSARRKFEKKAYSHTNVNLRHGRQYFGTSQFEIESLDPVESFELEQEEAEDENSAPSTVRGHSSQSAADDDVDLIIIPQTDPPKPSETEEGGAAAEELTELVANGRANNHLPPKRILTFGFEDLDGLTLRPDSQIWLRGVTRVSETPPLSDAARPKS